MELNPLGQIQPVVIIAVAIIFAATFVLLRRVFVLPYVAVMTERDRLIEESEARDAEAARIVAAADADAAALVETARVEADGALREARARADDYRRERLHAATDAASERLQAGRELIGRAREREEEVVRRQAIECVELACERLFKVTDREIAEAAVDKLLSRRAR
ncbi:MAG: hypothetical protein FDZ70_04005 [Actinobacteria bacterium]|nr:MAG: hypothetical protein FDZ70_04005 [Actinomycetota bacterium]